MDTLVKYTTTTLSSFYFLSIVKPRHKAYYFGKTCDPQSKCAIKAREIYLLLDKKKNIPEQNERIKEEIWFILDHEKLLSEYNCCALAKLTIYELLKFMMDCKASEDLILFVEAIDQEMEKKYSQELTPDSHMSTDIDLQALMYKHLGNGMQYLKQKHHNDKKKNKACLAKKGSYYHS